MSARDEYFARVAPLLGRGLQDAVVAVDDIDVTARVVELLASCMLRDVAVGTRDSALERLQTYMTWKNGFGPMRWLPRGGAGARVRGAVLEPGRPSHVVWEGAHRRVTLNVAAGDDWAHRNLSYAVARRLRDVLMGRSAWPEGVVYHGNLLWPFSESGVPPPASPPPRLDHGRSHVLIVGAGSVGSEVVRLLAPRVGRLTLVDDARVTVFNPHRQWFGTSEIGQLKVEALARRLGPRRVKAVPRRVGPANRELFASLIEAHRPDVVLLSTGTSDDATLAEDLVSRGIPHVAAYAYPQARFFEVTVVEAGTPCLHCYRGNLFRGVESAAPMPDETARFLYRAPDEAARELLYRNLVAEPASAIETGRVADVAWLCLTELLAPHGARSAWFERVLSCGTNCLLGGNVVEECAHGETAYGLTYPGQVVRLGVGDIAGAGDHADCSVCHLRLPVTHDLGLEDVAASDADSALLS
jgi:hypothetical protein